MFAKNAGKDKDTESWLTSDTPNPYTQSSNSGIPDSVLPAIDFARDLTGTRGTPSNNNDTYTAADLPVVDDPEMTYANITRDEFLRQQNEYGQLRKDAVNEALTDTSLIDAAKADAPRLAQLSRDIVRRNQERYGVSLTPAQRRARDNASLRGEALATAGSINNARLNQFEQNRSSLGRLMAVSSNTYSTALGGLGNAAQNAAARNQAYKSAKANAKSQRINTIGSIAAAGLMAFGI
jgi:hypothetical protein